MSLESFVITWRELLLIVVVVLAIYMAEMLLLLRAPKSGGRFLGRRGGIENKALAQRLENLESGLDDVRRQLAGMEALLARQGETAPPEEAPPAVRTPYGQAIELARQGVDVVDLAESCGISRGEAELIVAMHRTRDAE